MTKDKDILQEHIKAKTKPRSKQTQVNQNHNKVAVAGNATINIMEATKGLRYDETAELQGRTPDGVRLHGTKVDVKHMTPKEYRNFLKKNWDGVERADDRVNWSAWDWEADRKILDEPVDRRTVERRIKQVPYKGKNRRKSQRRERDKSNSVHENILYYSGLAIGYGTILTLYILIALGGA